MFHDIDDMIFGSEDYPFGSERGAAFNATTGGSKSTKMQRKRGQ